MVVSPPPADPERTAELEEAWQTESALELDLKAKRARIALWTTAGVLAAGVITFSVGLTQCTEFTNRVETVVVCNRAGEVLEPLGRALMYGGAIGALTSGIILAVRNKKRRDLRRAEQRPLDVGPADD